MEKCLFLLKGATHHADDTLSLYLSRAVPPSSCSLSVSFVGAPSLQLDEQVTILILVSLPPSALLNLAGEYFFLYLSE